MNHRRSPASPRAQRGIATLLIVLVVGLAVGVTVLASAYSLHGTQQRQLTTHSVTAAQGAAWRGVETLRIALLAAGPDPIQAWGGPEVNDDWSATCDTAGTTLNVAVEGMEEINVSNARLTHICRTDTPDTWRLTAQVTGHSGSDSLLTTSTVEVVYGVGKGTVDNDAPGNNPSPSPPLNAVITFNNDLNLSGSITILTNPGQQYEINVHGDLTTGGNTITGVDTIRATGSIQISSGSSFGALLSNGDIKFDGSVSASRTVAARGDICISGGASAADATLRANGSVVADGGVTLGDVFAIGSSDRGDQTSFCDTVALDADGEPYAVDLQGNAGARTVAATGSVRIDSGSITANDGLRATGHLVDTNWGGTEYGRVGGTVTGANPATTTWVQSVPGLQVPISPVSPVTLETTNFNAYDIEAAAHYAFKIDSYGYKVVTVRAVNGITDGTYFIGDYDNNAETGWSRGYKDFLCSELAAGSTPQAPRCRPPVADPPGTICTGYSTYNNCLSYDASTRTWTIEGISMAPGIAWFEGSLHLGNGTFYNSLVATRNITMGGSIKVYALAYAGFDGTRTVDGTETRYAPTGICENSHFQGRYPLDYCDTANDSFIHPEGNVIGHYALLAGSYDADGSYIGGDISLGTSAEIFGSVLSGNLYSSGGSTRIHGSVTALSQGDGTHQAGGSTTIDLRELPEGYLPIIDPCALAGTCTEEEDDGTTETGFRATVRWSRYL